MVRGISTFTNLPMPLKAGLIVASGGGSLAALKYLFPGVFWYVLIGLALVALSLLLYWRLLKWMKKRKAAPMEQDLLKSSSATPQGISEPANLAKLDDLRKKFEEGSRKFQSAGKSLYSFPWYVIVGEPGSGKTEAIRHCNVGFPPGLQDEFQGTGGTINMNWWFTDHAVILDTAGRLMFEEVETGGSKEWREFLNLMKKYRPRCPINGVLLVIPADSLIRDTADQIEQKASKIARQFDVIQRTLDVRFPVFVVVTKSDLINGFRDFFDNLQDPQLQHQILGWSNPAPLDEPYNPDFVDQHLKAIQGRLFRRRLALLQEVTSEEPREEEIRTADTLYAFPQSLTKIAPRMARYLELIFSVGSKWSCKPLFFRGIYFTSSMREGSALDEDLAESLGVPVDSLPDGRVWERDRAYFLRDLFVKKIFREQGLVTYATNAKSLHRRRKAAVLISAAVSVIFLLVLTYLSHREFDRRIGDIKKYFVTLAKLMPAGDKNGQNDLEVLTELEDEDGYFYDYSGHEKIQSIAGDVRRYNVSALLDKAVRDWDKKGKPKFFIPASIVSGKITSENLKKAQAALYKVNVLQPFVNASRKLMISQENGEWTRESWETRTLRQLIQLKANKPLNDKDEYYSAEKFLDPFLGYVIRNDLEKDNKKKFNERSAQYEKQKITLHQPLKNIYKGDWPPAFLKTDPNLFETAINNGVDLYNTFWNAQCEQVAKVETIKMLKYEIDQFDDAERRIIALKDRFEEKGDALIGIEQKTRALFVSDWNGCYDELSTAKRNIDANALSLGNPKSLAAWWTTEAKGVKEDVNENYNFLLDELDSNELAEGSFLKGVRKLLEGQHEDILKRLTLPEFEQRLKVQDVNFYARVGDRRPLYDIRFEMYSKANVQLSKTEPNAGKDGIEEFFDEEDMAEENAQSEIEKLQALESEGYRVKDAAGICGMAVKLGGIDRRDYVVKNGLEDVIKRIRMFLNLREEESYDPNVAIPVIHDWNRIGDWLSQTDLPKAENARVRQNYNEARPEYDKYTKGYIDYWLMTKPRDWVQDNVPLEDNWKAQYKRIEELDVLDVLDKLKKFGKTIEDGVLVKLGNYRISHDDGRITQFRDNVKKLKINTDARETLEIKCDRLLEKWGELTNDAFIARNKLLSYKPSRLEQYYFTFFDRSPVPAVPDRLPVPAEFVDRYWAEMALVSLRRLAKEIQREGGEAFKTLRTQYGSKFPLAWESTQDLTIDDLKETHLLLSRALPFETQDEESVGAGKETEIELVEEQLRLLRVPPASGDLTWVDGIKQVFQGLPEGGNPYYCKISVLSRKEYDESLRHENEEYLADTYPWCRLVQGDETNKQERIRNMPIVMLGIVKYPLDKPIELLFYKSEIDKDPKSLKFPAPWACLKMLHDYSKPDKGEGYIKIKLEKEELPWVLWLQLKFCKESNGNGSINFPKTDEWPSYKK
jgi:hypothetical protein